MSCNELAIGVDGVSKCFAMYESPADRLKQFVLPRLSRLGKRQPSRYYKEYWALRDISFQIGRGEQVGIVGRNGAGKSTLLQIICGTLEPTTGNVYANGRVAALLELGAGFNPELTGSENVFLNGSVLGLSRRQIEERYDEILAFADIGEFVDQPVKNYSSGMYLRLAFAIASHVEPDVLIVDEALSVGDEAFQRKCNARIARIRDAGATILFVSHSAGHVVEVCNRALLLEGGELLSIGPAKHVVARYQKLLYAPVGKVAEIREDLRLEAQAGCLPEVAEVSLSTVEAVIEKDDAYYDAGMVPKSTVVYANHGCRLENPHLRTLDGRRVNILQPGNEYIYAYRAIFQSTAVAVRFGMMVKTVAGIELGGSASTPVTTSHPHFSMGDEVDVSFRFRAAMTPGTYFLNAGVMGLLGEQEHYLCRYVDVAMFRVLSSVNAVATGLVDFGVAATVTVRLGSDIEHA